MNCLNGGFCIDLIDDYRCVCATGFTGQHCDRIDDSVCEMIPNHVWRYNDTECEKICICQESPKVNCKCQQETTEEQMSCDSFSEGIVKSEIRVVFDSPVTMHSCNTIYAIQLLVADNDNFCCYTQSPNEVIIRIEENNPLAQFITRTIFPHIMHVIVNSNSANQSTWSILNIFITTICLLSMLVLYYYIHSYYKKRRQQSDAENVVIHCIQNNLKSSNDFKCITPPNSNTMSKKLCNTLQYDRSKIGLVEQTLDISTTHYEIKKCLN